MTKPCLPARDQTTAVDFTMPPGACDSHAHVFGPFERYPLAEDRSYTPREYVGSQFIRHLDDLHLDRGVLVTASAYGADNRSVLEALAEFPDRLRGIIVPSPDLTERQLDDWSEAGVRGVRVNLYKLDGQSVYRNGAGLEVLEQLAPRLAARGWHAQIWIHAPDLPETMPALKRLGLPLVVDHMGRMSTARGTSDPGFQFLCRQLAEGTIWTKISGADRISRQGVPYEDVDPFVQAILAANGERVVWGTDWPHINYFDETRMPDDGMLANLLARWLPDDRDRKKVLVDNPATLYDFPN